MLLLIEGNSRLAQNGCAASAGAPDFPLDSALYQMRSAHTIVIAVSMSRSATDFTLKDPAELRRFAAALATEVHAKTLLIEKLRMQLSILRRARFGRSSEKLDREIEQLELLLGDIEEGDAERQARTEASDGEASSALPSKKPSVRMPLPDHLPLETVMHEAPCVCPTCGATKFGRISAPMSA